MPRRRGRGAPRSRSSSPSSHSSGGRSRSSSRGSSNHSRRSSSSGGGNPSHHVGDHHSNEHHSISKTSHTNSTTEYKIKKKPRPVKMKPPSPKLSADSHKHSESSPSHADKNKAPKTSKAKGANPERSQTSEPKKPQKPKKSNGEPLHAPAAALLISPKDIAAKHEEHAKYYTDKDEKKASQHRKYAEEAKTLKEGDRRLKVLGHLSTHHDDETIRPKLEAEHQKQSTERLTRSQRKQQRIDAKKQQKEEASSDAASDASGPSGDAPGQDTPQAPAAATLQSEGGPSSSGWRGRAGQAARATAATVHGVGSSMIGMSKGLANLGLGAASVATNVVEGVRDAGVSLRNYAPNINPGGVVTPAQGTPNGLTSSQRSAVGASASSLGVGSWSNNQPTSSEEHAGQIVRAAHERQRQEQQGEEAGRRPSPGSCINQ